MLTLPPKFKQALGNGTRTSLYPLVRIYKGVQIDDPLDSATEVINLSIKETNIGGEAYNGLLLNSPSISSKADIINNKYTISSVSLSISNAPYNGKIFSDDIPSLLNAVVQVYYSANGLDSLDDCLLVYTGTIRRYSQSAETLNLTLEDLTEQKLKTQIPSTLIDDFTVYPDEQIGKPYPMVYGYVDKSPLILDKFDSLIIDKPETEIGGIWENVSNIDFDNEFINDSHPLIASEGWLRKKSFLYTYKDGYCPIMEKMPYKFGSREHIIEDDMMYDFENQSVGNPAKINLNYLNFLYTFYVESDDELIGKGEQGIPTRIYRPVKKISFFAKNHERREEGFPPVNYSESVNKFYGFTANQNYDATLEPNHSGGTTPLAEEYYFNDWNEQNPNATFTWWKSTELNYQKDIVLPDDNIQDDWINSFSMNEQSEAKNVIQNLFKSSIYIPSFDSDGNFKFIDLKQKIEDYEQFEVIDNLDIIKYSFGLTKLEDVKNQVNVKYKKDYGSDELTEETSYGIENNNQTLKENLDDVTKELTPNMLYDIAYYGMKNEDAKLEVESEYIRDKNTARKLQRRLLMWYANQHLTMKLDLPTSYIHLEAGDYLRFDELIGGKHAFGFDYTQEFVKNGQLIYPVFFVTKVAKSLSKVSLELVQVHRGDFGMSDDDLGNYEIPNPYDNKLYQPYVETDEDYFKSVWYNDNNLLESGPINAIVNTNFETDIEFNIKLIYSSQRFNYGNIEIFEGDNDIDALSLVYARRSVTESSFGNNIEINPIIDIDNIYGAADNYELKFELEIISNVDSSYTTILEFSHRFEKETALLGDMNNDGGLNVLDVILIAQETFNPEPNPIADINQDGVVNVVDVLIILNQVLGD